jgi:hypothetical protein
MPTVTSAEIPVSESDLDVIRDRWGRLESGYHGVYRKHRGRSSLWQARPYSSGGPYTTGGRKGRLGPRVLAGTFKTPREAARCVVRWYKRHFGENWVAAYRTKTHNPWWCRRVPGGWQLVVRVRGTETVVPAPRTVLFPDRTSAAAYFARWAADTYGEDAWLALRAGVTSPPPA